MSPITSKLVVLISYFLFVQELRVDCFAPPIRTVASRRPFTDSPTILKSTDSDDNDLGMLSESENLMGGNWMKRSSTELSGNSDDDTIYMDVGIGGKEFGTGPLSKRMYDVMMNVASRQHSDGRVPKRVNDLYLLYAMDASAKEAVKVAMESNGYQINLGDNVAMQDVGAWGALESVVLLDPITEKPIPGENGALSYQSWQDVIDKGGWEPGDGFSFTIRRVPARKKGLDLSSLLKALDPEGKLREEAKAKGILMPDEDVASLKDLSVDCMQRVNGAPVEALGEADVFRGGKSKGYNVISRKELMKESRNADNTENIKTMMHVMDALANHGCLIVDLTNENASLDDAIKINKMWQAAENFFKRVADGEPYTKELPPMAEALGVGSSHAMVGFASYKDGENQFLETRIRRSDGILLPEVTRNIIGDDGVKSIVDSFSVITQVGKDIVRIVTAASSIEAEAFATLENVALKNEEEHPSIAGLSFEEITTSGIDSVDNSQKQKLSEFDLVSGGVLASDAAILLTEEIIDDGKHVNESLDHIDSPVSMSPHRICCYSNNRRSKKESREVFGAHTDTSFVTIIPAASVSGLEVFDEDSLQWYRPELYARRHAKVLDPLGNMDDKFSWNSRYLIVIPGEILQITSRNNVPAAVHRVVASNEAERLSAPVLLRARSGMKLNVERYMGNLKKANSLLLDCNGMKMEDIHDALQPKPMHEKESSNDWE